MRRIASVIIHCTDSDSPYHDNIDTIRRWHVEERNFNDVGYHYVITKQGLSLGRPVEKPGAHCRPVNGYSLGIALTGRNLFSDEQFEVLDKLIINLMAIFNLEIESVQGHYEIDNNKTCPNFNMVEYRDRLRSKT